MFAVLPRFTPSGLQQCQRFAFKNTCNLRTCSVNQQGAKEYVCNGVHVEGKGGRTTHNQNIFGIFITNIVIL